MTPDKRPTDCDPLWTFFESIPFKCGVLKELRGRKQCGYTAEVVVLVAEFTAIAEDRLNGRVDFVLGIWVRDALEGGESRCKEETGSG